MSEKKEKRYVIDNAQLMTEWDWEKNRVIGLDPTTLLPKSNKKAWWMCKKGHEWKATIADRTLGSGCPYCSGKIATKGVNDLQTVQPRLSEEWNYSLNGDLTPSDVLPTSNKKVWWVCKKGHEWQSTIYNRTLGNGCPFCSGRVAISGVNDLQTLNPNLAKEWNYSLNGDLTPSNVLPRSHFKVWWICEHGHEWQAIINNRTKGRGCPFCTGRIAISGVNDLQTLNPNLAKEWDYSLNENLKPSQLLPSSNKKVWWKCERGHNWQASVNHRNAGEGCPICSSELRTSFPEYALIYYLRNYGVDALHSQKELGYELDVFIPKLKIAIEYDGGYWHKNRINEDLAKNARCEKDGIKLYRIREGLSSLNSTSIDFVIKNTKGDLPDVIRRILNDIIKAEADVDLQRDFLAIEQLRVYSEKVHSLASLNQALALEWNYEKNGELLPEHVTSNSNKNVWWKCSNGHEWQATIQSRNTGNGCPFCSGRVVISGVNDLQTLNPALAKEWDVKKNCGISPSSVMANSGKKVWWKCANGHEWQATVAKRNSGSGCPKCWELQRGKVYTRALINKHGSLLSNNPVLASQWHPTKNGTLSPKDVTEKSGRRVWWICTNGHEWEASVSNRTKGSSCPHCYNEKRRKSKQ